MRTHRRKPPLHKRVRQDTKKSIRTYQFGGTAEEEYQLGLALIKEGKFSDAAVQFQTAMIHGHPTAFHWLEYAKKRSMIPKFIDANEIMKEIESVYLKTKEDQQMLDPNTPTFYLTYLINQGNSIRATHALLYNKIIEQAKPIVYPPTPSRLHQAQNMLGSLAFWRGGAIEQELYDSALQFDPKKVQQMAEFVIDAGQHSLVSSNQYMLLLISNIAQWISLGTTEIDLAHHIVTASKNLTEIHLLTEIQSKRQEGQDAKTARINAEAELTSYFMQMESNLVKALQSWDSPEIGYSKLVKNIMGEAAAGGKIVDKVIKGIKTTRFIGGDVRAEILASIPNTAQCDTGMLDPAKKRCYLCGFALGDYIPNELTRKDTGKGKAKKDCVDKGQTLCPPNAIDCEHVLGIQLALSHLNLVHTGKQEYQKTTSDVYKSVINKEYDWSHKCCNMMKLDRSFIRKIVEGPNTGFYEPDRVTIESVLSSISEQAKINKDGKGYAYGCGCIGAVNKTQHLMSTLVKDQLENVIARVEMITEIINLQIAGIRQHLENQGELAGLQKHEIQPYRRACEVYDSFIKFRFLSRITKNNWIKALTNNFRNKSITPGSIELNENSQMEGGAKFGLMTETQQFIKLANDQMSYEMCSIQLMSDDTVVDNIREIVKDICENDKNEKNEKLKVIKEYINDNMKYKQFSFFTYERYGKKTLHPRIQKREANEHTQFLKPLNEDILTIDSTKAILSEFLNGTIPLELDKKISMIEDPSTNKYREDCKLGFATIIKNEERRIATYEASQNSRDEQARQKYAKSNDNAKVTVKQTKAYVVNNQLKLKIPHRCMLLVAKIGTAIHDYYYSSPADKKYYPLNEILVRYPYTGYLKDTVENMFQEIPDLGDFYTEDAIKQKIIDEILNPADNKYITIYKNTFEYGKTGAPPKYQGESLRGRNNNEDEKWRKSLGIRGRHSASPYPLGASLHTSEQYLPSSYVPSSYVPSSYAPSSYAPSSPQRTNLSKAPNYPTYYDQLQQLQLQQRQAEIQGSIALGNKQRRESNARWSQAQHLKHHGVQAVEAAQAAHYDDQYEEVAIRQPFGAYRVGLADPAPEVDYVGAVGPAPGQGGYRQKTKRKVSKKRSHTIKRSRAHKKRSKSRRSSKK